MSAATDTKKASADAEHAADNGKLNWLFSAPVFIPFCLILAVISDLYFPVPVIVGIDCALALLGATVVWKSWNKANAEHYYVLGGGPGRREFETKTEHAKLAENHNAAKAVHEQAAKEHEAKAKELDAAKAEQAKAEGEFNEARVAVEAAEKANKPAAEVDPLKTVRNTKGDAVEIVKQKIAGIAKEIETLLAARDKAKEAFDKAHPPERPWFGGWVRPLRLIPIMALVVCLWSPLHVTLFIRGGLAACGVKTGIAPAAAPAISSSAIELENLVPGLTPRKLRIEQMTDKKLLLTLVADDDQPERGDNVRPYTQIVRDKTIKR